MKKILAVCALFLAALGALIGVGVASAIPVVSVAQLATPEYPGGTVEVKDGKVAAIESLVPLRFTISRRDGPETETVRVESPRTVPESFKVGIDVGLRGAYDPGKKLFQAYQVTTKCPSKYEASKDGELGPGAGYPTAGKEPGAGTVGPTGRAPEAPGA
ncbi:MAG: cytochrome c maturation protein CcmE [Planctomycetes bacterium]|nr:cytochrome c maturation protein CcmE [Planctomycetota bacterium]